MPAADPPRSRVFGHFGDVEVVNGIGADLPFGDATFDAVVCFTMLHHVSSVTEQDKLFAEARRVLSPGGLFAGTDSIASIGLRDFHRGDTYVPVDPSALPARLTGTGFLDVLVWITEPRKRFAFNAFAPR